MSDEGLDEKAPEFGGNYSREREEVREENGGLGAENEERFRVGNGEGMVGFREGEELREEDVELGSEDEKRVTMQLSPSSNKRVNQVSIDRLSELPDPLLIHILSFLGVMQAAVTGVLSKRWQFLWSDLPELEFLEIDEEYWDSSRDGKKIGRFVSLVNKALAVRTANYLEKFAVWFQYSKCYAYDVDAWVEFALKNKVKKLTLLLNTYNILFEKAEKAYYMLPDSIYSHSSMTCLCLQRCIMAPQRTIEWQSLTELYISEVGLNQNAIDDILLGCPVLYSLELDGCWGFDRLEVISRSLHSLKVINCEDDEDEPLLEISAPYLHTLNISVFPEGRRLQVKNFPSLVKACINFNGNSWDSTSVEAMSIAKDLLESYQLVKELDLGKKFFEVVSMMVVNDWQLPQSTRMCLQVTTSDDHDLCVTGIIGLLESSPDLESLVIKVEGIGDEYEDLDLGRKDDLSLDLPKLKTVNIRILLKPNGEVILTLARLLLKRAPVLEKMVIRTKAGLLDDFNSVRQALLTYPRSSQRAVVLFDL